MRELRRIRVSGVTYTVQEATAEEVPDLADREGETDSEKATICVREDIPEDRREVLLLHEVCHAAIYESGAYQAIRAAVPPVADPTALEERIVLGISAALPLALRDLGWRAPVKRKGAP